jgi:hypothetical protein
MRISNNAFTTTADRSDIDEFDMSRTGRVGEWHSRSRTGRPPVDHRSRVAREYRDFCRVTFRAAHPYGSRAALADGWVQCLVGSVMLQRSVGQVVATGRPDGLLQLGQRSWVCQRSVGQVVPTGRPGGLLQFGHGSIAITIVATMVWRAAGVRVHNLQRQTGCNGKQTNAMATQTHATGQTSP